MRSPADPTLHVREATTTTSRSNLRVMGVGSITTALASCLVGCTVLLGFDKAVESADSPLESQPDSNVPPGTKTPDGRDAAVPDDDDGGNGDPDPVEPYVDPNFGGGGTGRILLPGIVPDYQHAVDCSAAVSADQSIWVACSNGSTQFYRLNADGSRDTTFPDTTSPNHRFKAIFARGDALLAVGSTPSSATNVIARYTTAGLDQTFGSNGFATKNLGALTFSVLHGGVVEGTRLRLWGEKYPPGGGMSNPFTVDFDLNTNTFGATVASTDAMFTGTSSSDPQLTAIGLHSVDASTVLFFGLHGPFVSGSIRDFGFARLKNGSPDATFGTGGLVKHFYNEEQTAVTAGAVINGKIVMASGYYNYGRTVLSRWSLAGVVDTTFGNGGFLPLGPGPGTPAGYPQLLVRALLPLPENGFMLGGTMIAGTVGEKRRRIFIAKFDAAGALDTTFGDGGFAYPKIQPTPTTEEVFALALQGDGGVIALGQAETQAGNYELYALRLKP